jgi:hypothetical protein
MPAEYGNAQPRAGRDAPVLAAGVSLLETSQFDVATLRFEVAVDNMGILKASVTIEVAI